MKGWRYVPALVAVGIVLIGATPSEAQRLSYRAGAGIALPVGDAADRRDVGPAASLAVEARLSRLWSVRLEADWSRLNGPTAPPGDELFSNYQDLRSLGASLSAVLRFSDGPVSPYILAGAGAYRLQRVDAPDSSYGTTSAVQAGFGSEVGIADRFDAFAEARAQLHLTDYGATDFRFTTFWPVLIGVRYR